MPKKLLTTVVEEENDVSHRTASLNSPAGRTRGQIAKEAKSTSIQIGDANETEREPSASTTATSIEEDDDNLMGGASQSQDQVLQEASADGQPEDVGSPDMEPELQSPAGSEKVQPSDETQNRDHSLKEGYGQQLETEAHPTLDEGATADDETAEVAPEEEQAEGLASTSVPKSKRGRHPKAAGGKRMAKPTISGDEDAVAAEEAPHTEAIGSQPPMEGEPSEPAARRKRGRPPKVKVPSDSVALAGEADAATDNQPSVANTAPSQEAPKTKRGRPRKSTTQVEAKPADTVVEDVAASGEQPDGRPPTADEENEPHAEGAPSQEAPKKKRGRPRKSTTQVEAKLANAGDEDAAASGEQPDGPLPTAGEGDEPPAEGAPIQEAQKRKRVRPSKAKANAHMEEPVDDGVANAADREQQQPAKGAPSEQAPKRKRGRPRKSAPQVDEGVVVGSGAGGPAASGEQPDGQPPAAGEEDEPPADAAPNVQNPKKKRGRPRKSTTQVEAKPADAGDEDGGASGELPDGHPPTAGEEGEPHADGAPSQEAPKRKRGRPRKSTTQVEAKPADAGDEDAAASGEQLDVQPPTAGEEDEPPAEAAQSQEAPKRKRGRPRKSTTQVEADGSVGTGEDEAADGSGEPTKGQPPAVEEAEAEDNLAAEAGPSEPTPRRKRGRPPKAKPQAEAQQPATDEDDGDGGAAHEDQPPTENGESDLASKKKRGRPPKALDGSSGSASGEPGKRKRGRPRKHPLPAAGALYAPSSQVEAGAETPKAKRGRPPGSGKAPAPAEDDGAAAGDMEAPKRKRGRPLKQPAPEGAAAEGDPQSDAGDAVPKRKPGRPPKNPQSQQALKPDDQPTQALSFRPPARSHKRKSSRPRPSA